MAVSAASPLLLLLLAAAPGVAAAAAVGLAPPPPSAARRASALLSKLNTTQKLGLLSGVYGLGWNCAVGEECYFLVFVGTFLVFMGLIAK
eukprot:SAG31_NODE_2440_length_5690_cov_23.385262_2_plen_90_part_00